MAGRLRRSALYMPGSNARALDKARTLAADVLILDLEDAVAPDAKDLARHQACAAVAAGAFPGREVVIRINGLSTPWGADDLAAAAAARPDAVLLPKVETPAQLADLRARLAAAGAPQAGLWAMMETPRAVLGALPIAEAASGLAPDAVVLVVGTNDLVKEARMQPGPDRALLLPWLTTLLAAARACGLPILDGVYNGLDDPAGFIRECVQGRRLGMDGKTLVHPAQIAPCHAAFAPGAEEVEWARRIVTAFDDPANAGRNVVQVEGRMVERLHLEAARRDLAAASADDSPA